MAEVAPIKQYLQAKKEKKTGDLRFPVDAAAIEGGDEALQELSQRPEYQALPHLSRALGEKGHTGKDFPATFALHSFARKIATQLDIKVAPLERKSSEVGYCVDMRQLGGDCFGMCGDGCNCWDWVCGDCCCHDGCNAHDQACADCGWDVWACLECYTPLAAFVWAFGGGCGTSCDPWWAAPTAPSGCGNTTCYQWGGMSCPMSWYGTCDGCDAGCANFYDPDCDALPQCGAAAPPPACDNNCYSCGTYTGCGNYCGDCTPSCGGAYQDCTATWTCCDWGYQCAYDYNYGSYTCQYYGY